MVIMIKKILAGAAAVSMAFCLFACTKGGENTPVTSAEAQTSTTAALTTTAMNAAEQSRFYASRNGFELLMTYVNIFELNGYEVPIDENTTCDEVIAYMETFGSEGEIVIDNFDTSGRFLDYARLSDGSDSGDKYVLRTDVDWISLYVD